MTDISIPQGNSVHKEDISTILAGTVIVGGPCTIWNILVSSDITGVGIVNFSDTATSYAAASRKLKVVVNGVDTKVIEYPKGLYLANGLCATANKASMNISVVYD